MERVRKKPYTIISDDPYKNLACMIIKSGVEQQDFDFLRSEWCDWLLEMIGLHMSGMQLYAKVGDFNG